MRKKILLLLPNIFLGLILISLAGTEVRAQQIKIGLRGGASFANFYQHDASKTLEAMPIVTPGPGPFPMVLPYAEYETSFFGDMRTGVLSGLFIEWKLTDRWNIESGINYTQKGINLSYRYTTTYTDNNNREVMLSHHAKRDLRMNYVTLPVVFKYKLDKQERFYLAAGIYHAVAMDMKNKTSYNKTVLATQGLEQISISEPTKFYANLFDAGVIVGAGVEWPIQNKWTIGFDVRGNLGVIQVPHDYEEHGFAGFNESTRNVNIESSLKIARWLR